MKARVVRMAVFLALILLGGAVGRFFWGRMFHEKKSPLAQSGPAMEDLSAIFRGSDAPLEWGLDPFRVSAVKESGLKDFKPRLWNVTGILQSADGAAAIVDDRIVHPGDDLDGFTVVEIRKDRVVIKRGEEVLELFQKGENR